LIFGKPLIQLQEEAAFREQGQAECRTRIREQAYTTKLATMSGRISAEGCLAGEMEQRLLVVRRAESFFNFRAKVGRSMSFSRNFWCNSSDSSSSFAIDAEENSFQNSNS